MGVKGEGEGEGEGEGVDLLLGGGSISCVLDLD